MPHPNRIGYYRDRCDPPLTQSDLARILAVHANTVQNWERRGMSRPDALLRLTTVFVERGAITTYPDAVDFWRTTTYSGHAPPPELRHLFARGGAAGEAHLLALPLDRPPPPRPTALHALPYRPNPRFVGRDADLRVLAALLRPARAVVAICGIGGLGKTQLAVEFAHRYGPLVPGGVCWIDAAEPSRIPGQVAAWGAQAGGPAVAQQSFERRLALALEAWREPAPRLLIFDNCEAPESLFEWLPLSGGSRVIVTSRARAWAAYPHVAILDLQPLQRPESLALLGAAAARQQEEPERDAIAAVLGDLPLALHLAGKHLAHTRAPAAAYVAQLRRGSPLRHASLQVVGPSPTAYGRSLAEVISHAYRQLDERAEDGWGRRVLMVARHLAAGVAIPDEFLYLALGVSPEARPQVAAALARLSDDLGLVDRLHESRELRVHPVVHAFLAERPADPADYAQVVQAVCARAEAAVAANEVLAAPLMAHLRHVADEAERRDAPQAIELCRALGWPLAISGQFQAARHYAERAVERCERRLGPRHPTLAGALNILALIEQITGAFPAAEAAFLRALAIWEEACGPQSEEVATASNNLGFLALRSGRYDEARLRLRRALRLRRGHADLRTDGTARIIHNLGYLALQQGQLRRAHRYLRLALAIRRQLFAEANLATAFTLALLADTRLGAGDLAAATECASEALAMRQSLGGSDVGASLAQLGRIARAAGDLPGAAALVEQAVDIRRAVLGPQASETLQDMALLGGIYREQGRAAEARQLLDAAVAGLAAAVGEGSLPLAQAIAERDGLR